jgi:hypothetical protein
MKTQPILLIAFIILSIILLATLPSSREGADATLSRPATSAPPVPFELASAVQKMDVRLTALEKSVKESKDRIAGGEAEANAAVGNLQVTLPS